MRLKKSNSNHAYVLNDFCCCQKMETSSIQKKKKLLIVQLVVAYSVLTCTVVVVAEPETMKPSPICSYKPQLTTPIADIIYCSCAH